MDAPATSDAVIGEAITAGMAWWTANEPPGRPPSTTPRGLRGQGGT